MGVTTNHYDARIYFGDDSCRHTLCQYRHPVRASHSLPKANLTG